MNVINRLIWHKRIRFWKQKLEHAERMEYLRPWLREHFDNSVRAYKELDLARRNND